MNYTQKADKIVNMLINEYGFELLTVDSLAIREGIVRIMQDHTPKLTPTIGALCWVLDDGVMKQAEVTGLLADTYTAVQKGTGIKHSNIPNSIWRPI